MGVSARVFQSAGRRSTHVRPGAYSRIDTTQTSVGQPAATNTVIIGRSEGGLPQTLLQFNNPNDAVRQLRGGPLMDAVRLAFSPGEDIVPERLFAVRVNNAEQATLVLEDGDSNPQIQVTSEQYGSFTNRIRVEMEDGTETGKRFRVFFGDDSEDFDNIERPSLSFVHASLTLTVTNTAGTQTLAASDASFEIDLNEYDTIGEVAAFIDAQSGWTATVEPGQEEASSLELDAVVEAPLTLFSNAQAVIDTVTAGSIYVDLARISGSYGFGLPTNFGETNLAGGANGDYDITQLSTVLEMLETKNIQFIATPDVDPGFQNAIKEHCVFMSSINQKKERQFLVGAPWGATVNSALAAARTLNARVGGMYVFNGGKQFDTKGRLTEYHSGYAACMLAGMNSALAIQEPLTAKSLNFIELENELTATQEEQLIKGGVAPINLDENEQIVCVRQITTFQGDDLRFNEFSLVQIMFFSSRDDRQFVQQLFIGGATSTQSPALIKSALQNRIRNRGEAGLYIDSGQGFVRNLEVSLTADYIMLSYEADLAAPLNFVFITNHFSLVENLAA